MGLLFKIANTTHDDIEDIEDWLFDCDIPEIEIIDFIREHIEELRCCLWEVNLKSLVFEYILGKADVSDLIECIDVDKETNTMELSASPKEIEQAMANVLVDDRNDSWLFLAEYFGIDINIEEQNN